MRPVFKVPYKTKFLDIFTSNSCNIKARPNFLTRGSLRSVVANVLGSDIVVSEFEFQSYYYTHFLMNTFGKELISIISTTMNSIVPLQFFYLDCFGIK